MSTRKENLTIANESVIDARKIEKFEVRLTFLSGKSLINRLRSQLIWLRFCDIFAGIVPSNGNLLIKALKHTKV